MYSLWHQILTLCVCPDKGPTDWNADSTLLSFRFIVTVDVAVVAFNQPLLPASESALSVALLLLLLLPLINKSQLKFHFILRFIVPCSLLQKCWCHQIALGVAFGFRNSSLLELLPLLPLSQRMIMTTTMMMLESNWHFEPSGVCWLTEESVSARQRIQLDTLVAFL